MHIRWLVLVGAVLGVVAADPALARAPKAKAKAQCVDRPIQFSLERFFLGPTPGPNGCAPAVFLGNTYVGQDPDPRIRLQLMRDPATGYASELY